MLLLFGKIRLKQNVRGFGNVPVDFKIVQCRLSIFRNGTVRCRFFEMLLSILK